MIRRELLAPPAALFPKAELDTAIEPPCNLNCQIEIVELTVLSA